MAPGWLPSVCVADNPRRRDESEIDVARGLRTDRWDKVTSSSMHAIGEMGLGIASIIGVERAGRG